MTALSIQHASTLLQNLLAAGGWRNSTAAISEALPHFSQELDPGELRRTIENLRVPFSEVRCRETAITAEDCPALVIPDRGPVYLARGECDGGLRIDRAGEAGQRVLPKTRRMVQVLRIEAHQRRSAEKRPSTVAGTLTAIKPMLPWLLLASLLSNCLGLLTPLLIMAIYDRVIPTGSVDLLVSLAIGVCVILAADFSFRQSRSLALAHVGRQVEHTLSIELFRKLMALPLQQMQKSDVDQQLSRFRQFEALRDMFSGQVMSCLLDLPFALIFLSVLMYLAPQVGLLTLGACFIFVLLSCACIPTQRRLDAQAAETSLASRSVLQDAVIHQRALVNLGLAKTWRLRSAPLIEEAVLASRRACQFQTSMQSLAQTVTAMATVAAIVLSARAALIGDLSFGGLIAVIALVAKVIAPLHALHANMAQILAFQDSRTQADRVLALPGELELGQATSHQKTLQGAIRFSGVTYRPDPLTAPILSQVSFFSSPGEVVLVLGNGIAGRTAVLELINGLYVPQAGTIEHDSIDARQIARDDLRRSISATQRTADMFYGTVAQNFSLGSPTISPVEMQQALADVGLEAATDGLADELDTRLRDDAASHLPESTLQALSLARSIARSTPIYLFSEPTNGLNARSRAHFKSWVERQKGERTIFVATSDLSFLQLADRFLFIDEGRLTVNDNGEKGLKKIKAMLQNLEEKA